MYCAFAGHKKSIQNFGRKFKGNNPLEGPVHGTTTMDLRSCTVHVDNIKFFICPTNAYNSYKTVTLLTHNRTEYNMQPQHR